MTKKSSTRKMIVDANRYFYDIVSVNYESIDGRRSPKLAKWLKKNLSEIRNKCSGGRLLDLGAGSGFVTKCAEGIFKCRVAVDVSQGILKSHINSFEHGIAADIDNLPFKSGSFDAVTCFAVLHHLHSYEQLFSEVGRVLKKDGVFYSDHDMDINFAKRFSIPIYIYRKLRNSFKKYEKINKDITNELYKATEYHENGIDSANIVQLLIKEGFHIEHGYHWFGLFPLADILFKEKTFKNGSAPLFYVIAARR